MTIYFVPNFLIFRLLSTGLFRCAEMEARLAAAHQQAESFSTALEEGHAALSVLAGMQQLILDLHLQHSQSPPSDPQTRARAASMVVCFPLHSCC